MARAMPTVSNGFQDIASSWIEPTSPDTLKLKLSNGFSKGIRPVPVHSHNDYLRRVPLFNALALGCEGIEADVWLKDGKLLVGHTENTLQIHRTLSSLYINPLSQILEQQNSGRPAGNMPLGVFESSPFESLTLLVDIKTDVLSAWPLLLQQLEPLRNRGWLTFYNGSDLIPGPITVVGTGNTPFSLVMSATKARPNDTDFIFRRDIFFDAPLAELSTGIYNQSNTYYASVSLGKAIGRTRFGVLNPQQLEIIAAQTSLASIHGLKARYWDTPSWPISWRNHVWVELVRHGVGILNADDISAASVWNWDWCTVLGVTICS
ncbi:MAG: hypothetical protein Q9218_002948 [Villophora microphyllina]